MGEAKRRREQFRKPQRQCVLCGSRPATTLDHVPPKGLFIAPRPRLITVPACEICNGGASEDEEQLKVFVSIKDGPHSPALQDFWREGGLRTVRNNQRLMRQLRSGPRLWLRSRETGRFAETSTYSWPVASHNRVIKKITRGLYYHHFGAPLSQSTRVEVTAADRLYDDVKNLVMGPEFARAHIGGDDRFCYAYARVAEVPEASIWVYQFYNRHWAMAVTEPDGFEFDEADDPP
jgi:hypothetical protein